MTKNIRRTILWMVTVSLLSITGLVGCNGGYQKGTLACLDEIINKKGICRVSSNGDMTPCEFSTVELGSVPDALYYDDVYKKNIYEDNHRHGIPEDDPDLLFDPYDMMLFIGGNPITVDRSQGDQLITSEEYGSSDDDERICWYRVAYSCYANPIESPGHFKEYDEINGQSTAELSVENINEFLRDSNITWNIFNTDATTDEYVASMFLCDHPASINAKRNNIEENIEVSTPFYITANINGTLDTVQSDEGYKIIDLSNYPAGLYLFDATLVPYEPCTPYGFPESEVRMLTVVQII